MSKRNKGTKLDSSQFFQATQTGIIDVAPVEDVNRMTNRRYDNNRDSDRYADKGSGRRFDNNRNNVGDGNQFGDNWRRGPQTSGSRFSSNPDSDMPSRATSDKWDSAFSKSTPRFSQVNTNSAIVEDKPRDKWASAFNKSNIKDEPAPIRSMQQETLSNDSLSKNLSNLSILKVNESPGNTTASVVSDAPKISSDATKAPIQSKVSKQENLKKARDAKDSLAAKALAAKKQLIDTEISTYDIASNIIATGLKGEELLGYITSLETKPLGSAFMKAVLASINDPLSLNWCLKSEYGTALHYLLSGKEKVQVRAIYALQEHCYVQKFPKLTVKEQTKYLFEVLMQLCYHYDILEHASFLAWADDDSDEAGKESALIQSSNFLQFLNEEDIDDEEEEDEEEIDSPLPTMP